MKKLFSIKNISVTLFILFILFVGTFTYAQETETPLLEPSIFGEGDSITLNNYVDNVFNLVITIAIVLAVIMIVIAGVEYTASTVPGAKEDAKGRLVAAIFGLLIALATILIVQTILGGGSIGIGNLGGGGSDINNNEGVIEEPEDNRSRVPVSGPRGCGHRTDSIDENRENIYKVGDLCSYPGTLNEIVSVTNNYCYETGTNNRCQNEYERGDDVYYFIITDIREPSIPVAVVGQSPYAERQKEEHGTDIRGGTFLSEDSCNTARSLYDEDESSGLAQEYPPGRYRASACFAVRATEIPACECR